MDHDADRRLMADSLARYLQGRADAPAVELHADLVKAGWLWPADDELLLPRAEHVLLVGVAIGRADAAVAYPADVLAASDAIDWAVLASCAVISGLLERLVDRTVDYVRTRKQFGVVVGSFQSVQHRAVDMHVAAQELQALLHASTAAMDTPARGDAMDRLRIHCGRAGRFVAQGAVQLHGAMGLTEELGIGRSVMRIEAELVRYRSPSAASARLQAALLATAE